MTPGLSSEPAISLALRKVLKDLLTAEVRAVTLEVSAGAPPACHVVVFHHGVPPKGLLNKWKAAVARALTDIPRHGAPKLRLTLKRADHPGLIVSAGTPLFVQEGASVSEPRPRSPPARGPAHSLEELEPLSPSVSARRPPTREVARARQIPIIRLAPQEMLALLHDGRGLRHILPHAIQAAQADPWADRGLHRGDLLMAVLHAPARERPLGSPLNRALVALARAALKASAKLPAARRAPDLEKEIARLLERWAHWPKG